MIVENKGINWEPAYTRDGRFGEWLREIKDWAISRSRFWGAPLPVWQSDDGDVICVGSTKELEELSGVKVEDLHKDVVDKISGFKNVKMEHPSLVIVESTLTPTVADSIVIPLFEKNGFIQKILTGLPSLALNEFFTSWTSRMERPLSN